MAQAQSSIAVGPKLGVSITDLRGEDAYVGTSSRGGFCGGLILHLPMSQIFSVQSELLFSQKGTNNQSIGYGNVPFATGRLRLSYVEVPLLAKLRISPGPFVEFGPTVSYLLSASGEFSSSNSAVDIRPNFKDFDLGYAAGIGFQDAKGRLLGLRYSRGLTDVFKVGNYPATNREVRIHNQAFQLYIGQILQSRRRADSYK